MLIWERWYALLNKDKKVYFNTDISMNNHMLLLGKLGSGKTVQAQKLMIEIVKQGGTVACVPSENLPKRTTLICPFCANH